LGGITHAVIKIIPQQRILEEHGFAVFGFREVQDLADSLSEPSTLAEELGQADHVRQYETMPVSYGLRPERRDKWLFAAANDKPAGQDEARTGEFVFLEAEQFADLGGWDLDQQSMDQMGSPYGLRFRCVAKRLR
jgi:hypothetical protein